jgi:hypothetical protein
MIVGGAKPVSQNQFSPQKRLRPRFENDAIHIANAIPAKRTFSPMKQDGPGDMQ